MFAPSRSTFVKMPAARQHLWLTRMLADGYAQIPDASEKVAERFYLDYVQCLRWINHPYPQKPSQSPRNWREWISDQFHFHQQQTHRGLGVEGFLTTPLTGDQLSEQAWKPAYAYWVALEKIRSAFNLGSIIRTTDSLGFAGVITGPGCPCVSHLQVKKTAMGAQRWIPVVTTTDFWGYLEDLSSQSYQLIGVERTSDSYEHTRYPWPTKAVLLFGNEEFGLTEYALNSLSSFVHLPMHGRKNSLNLGCTVSAIGYQIASVLKEGSC